MGVLDDLESWAEERNKAFEAGEKPTLAETVMVLGGTALAVGTFVGLIGAASEATKSTALAVRNSSPSDIAAKSQSIADAIVTIIAAFKGMSREQYDQHIAVQMQLDFQVALENVRSSNDLAKLRQEIARDVSKTRAESEAEIAKMKTKHEQDMARSAVERMFEVQNQVREVVLRAKEADLNQEREQRKKDQELEREQRKDDRDKKEQIKYANRVHVFPIYHQIDDLRRMLSKLYKERDELDDHKTDKPSWQKNVDSLESQIAAVEEHKRQLEAELHSWVNGKG